MAGRPRRRPRTTILHPGRFLTSDSAAPPPPVVIVGGGPVGLFLSHLLRHLFAIPHVLLEQQRIDDCFRHPQAHFLNTRTMELFRHCLSPTVSSQIVQAMPPVHQWQNFSFGSTMDAWWEQVEAKTRTDIAAYADQIAARQVETAEASLDNAKTEL